VSLPTVVANEQGEMKNGQRMADVTLHVADEGWLFEMGIPVCPSGTPWHLNVNQKIPLGFERDSTRESYLIAVRARRWIARRRRVCSTAPRLARHG